ncbi:Nuclear Hormone Receptor family [Caenorhabditis elegans]|uniref:Nuclear Hormone Receptor family n=1 Tax=Caenorhabditis elegans TaxID=6239 RepID=Q966H9_CAEEL|nr:Nuclear Hormone Receptor family [Caenorhabditis elegans]CCD62238.1 Nuclear Hormone Receptor family [Caenorhabditis elegans]|eukprot:NP_503209.2 Nuclear Hormone Receptor family [Caenorhabditis elegans]
MNALCSSSSSFPDLIVAVSEKCPVCWKHTAHGMHFGAFTCRACAAFFRRFATTKNLKPCKKSNVCEFTKNGYTSCKKCRLQRCFDIGMKIDNFQFERDPYKSGKIPFTLDTYLDRPSLIIFTALAELDSRDSKVYVDVQFLIDRAFRELLQGCESPIRQPNILKKLALGLEKIRSTQCNVTKILSKFGKDEVLAMWETDMLKIAKWFTYFDNFQKLPYNLQIDMIKQVWAIWAAMEKLANTANAKKNSTCESANVVLQIDDDLVACEQSIEIDLSWCSSYKTEQLQFFDFDHQAQLEYLVQLMVDLNPTDEELSYMLCHICFEHIKKSCDRFTQETVEQLQDTLSDHLHDYYINHENRPTYSGRIVSMIKLNNAFQKYVQRERLKCELMRLFKVLFVEYSNPELFVDYW